MISRSVDLLLCTRETSSLFTVRRDLVILVIKILTISYKYFTIISEIERLKWESESIQGHESPSEFVTLGLSRVVTKATFSFTVKLFKLRQMMYNILFLYHRLTVRR